MDDADDQCVAVDSAGEPFAPVLRLETTGGNMDDLIRPSVRYEYRDFNGDPYFVSVTLTPGTSIAQESVCVVCVGSVHQPPDLICLESRVSDRPVTVVVWSDGKVDPHVAATHQIVVLSNGVALTCSHFGREWRLEDARTCLELANVSWVDARGRSVAKPRLR